MTLSNLAKNNQENQYAIRVAGAIPPLTNLLSSDDPHIQQYAAASLSNLAQNESVKQIIVTYINKNESLKELIQANYSNLYNTLFSE